MFIDNIFYAILTDKDGNEFKLSEEQLKNAFSNCLKELRKYKAYTLQAVSDGTGIPTPTVLRYESGENTPSIIQAYKFSQFYNIGLEEMFLAGYLSDEEREKIFDESVKN